MLYLIISKDSNKSRKTEINRTELESSNWGVTTVPHNHVIGKEVQDIGLVRFPPLPIKILAQSRARTLTVFLAIF